MDSEEVETVIKKLNNNDYLFKSSIKVCKNKVFSIKCKQCFWAKSTDFRSETIYCAKYNMYSYSNQSCNSGVLRK